MYVSGFVFCLESNFREPKQEEGEADLSRLVFVFIGAVKNLDRLDYKLSNIFYLVNHIIICEIKTMNLSRNKKN